MAHPFAADLSLGPFDHNKSDDSELETRFLNDDALVVKERDKSTHCMQALGRKESHPAGFIDYLGALPVSEKRVAASSVGSDPVSNSEGLSTQLTLFYAGTVNVIENVPANKAQMIMFMAGVGNLSWPERVQVAKEGQAHEIADFLVPCQAMVPKALPHARKESLARFLERRKERVRMMAPYRGKGSQGVGCSNASTQILYNGLRAPPAGVYMPGFKTEFVGGNCAYAKEHDWVNNYENENSKQVSEGESAT